MACRNVGAPAIAGDGTLLNGQRTGLVEIAARRDAHPIGDVIAAPRIEIEAIERQNQLILQEALTKEAEAVLLHVRAERAIVAIGTCARGEVVETAEHRAVGVEPHGAVGRKVRIERRIAAREHIVHDSLARAIDARNIAWAIRESVRAGRVRIAVEIVEPGTIDTQRGLTIIGFHADGDIAAAISEVGAHEAADRIFLAVAALAQAHAAIELQALEVLLQDEVDDAADSIRTIGGRSTARDDLDGGGRDGVDVDDHVRIAGRGATTVDQHEVAVRTQTTQRDACGARRVGRRRLDIATQCRRLCRRELRQLVEVGFDGSRGRCLEQISACGHDRAVCGIVTTRDARAGDDDRFGLRSGAFGTALRLRRGCHEQRCAGYGTGQQENAQLRGITSIHQVSPPFSLSVPPRQTLDQSGDFHAISVC